ncbi:MAG: PD40 domain-containing protein [Ardenticatenaceae bacterium]|nr:PD40 domain-containing protein [Ardenticatenaceae bacterium]
MRTCWLIPLLIWLTACNTEKPETAVPDPHSPTGSLIFTQLEDNELNLVEYNLTTKQTVTLLTVPDRAWLSYAHASADGHQLVVAYAPAPPEGEIQFGYTDLYLMLREPEAVPRLVDLASGEGETFFDPVWSPDGRFLIYAHVFPADNSRGYVSQLERLHQDTGEIDILANDAIWPRLSPDGTQLAYVFIHPETLVNELIVTEADGRNPTSLLPSGLFEAVDVPIFSPDGTMVYFSGVMLATSQLSWWDRLLGVKTAAAHNLPSDWWRVPVTGSEPELIADIDDVGLHGAFSPDGRFLAYISSTGVYVMNPDGTNRQQLLETTALNGLSWVP